MAFSHSGVTNSDMAVMATVITMGAPTKPADTAASPMTNAPTMLTACPIGRGSRRPASRRISNASSSNSASIKAGKGVPSRALAIVSKRVVGISS